jgi:dethiobiotin synthetase
MSGPRRDFFVTGTDTGVGKTLVSAALLRSLRESGLAVAGMKPVASGAERTASGLRSEDALALLAESSQSWPYEVVNPYCFEPAIAPHIAAAEADVEIHLAPIEQAFRRLQAGSAVVIVEGAGGFLVPLGPGLSLADLPAALGLEVILVVGLRLGCLNHALLTAEAVASRGLKLAGWVGNRIDPDYSRLEGNLRSLERGLLAPCMGVVDYLDPPDAGRAAEALTRLAGIAALRSPLQPR